jgi:hypothetical protein
MRYANELIVELLQKVIDDQWSDRCNVACHCHPEYRPCCRECGQLEYKHLEDCSRIQLIKTVQAFLRAENEEYLEAGEDEFWIPSL